MSGSIPQYLTKELKKRQSECSSSSTPLKMVYEFVGYELGKLPIKEKIYEKLKTNLLEGFHVDVGVFCLS